MLRGARPLPLQDKIFQTVALPVKVTAVQVPYAECLRLEITFELRLNRNQRQNAQ